MNNKHIEISLIVGIIFLFITSILSPIVIGYKVRTTDRESIHEDYTFNYFEKYSSSKLTSIIETESKVEVSSKETIKLFLDKIQNERMQRTVTSGPLDSPWPMFMHDTHHTGRSSYSTANNDGVVKWKFRRWGCMESSPAIDNNSIIYIGGNKYYGPLWAVYPNGMKKWQFNTSGWVVSSPAITDDGTIYVGSRDGKMYAINQNGTEKWRFGAGGGVDSSPVIAEDGTIYFGVLGPGNDKGRVYAVNPNGTEKWHYDTGFWVYESPAIGNDGTVYISSNDDRLYALNSNNGTLKWKFKMGDWPGSPAIADDGTIYVASLDRYLYAIYPNGTLKWKHGGIELGSGNNPSIAEDGTIYIGGKHFYAINPNGTRKWTFNLGANFEVKTSSAVSTDGTIYFGGTLGGTSGGQIIAITSSGTEKWREGIANNWVYSSPAIGHDGTVYIGSSSMEDEGFYGILYAFGELDPNAPEAPSISGPTEGRIKTQYEYNFTTTDPNEDDVFYYIEWGDGKIEDWIGPYNSGEKVTINHTWNEKGTYAIRARVKDINNLWGPWSEFEVTMPKSKQFSNNSFLRFLENHPRIFPILRQLLNH
jgi:outer membrane protein assembly factor BamB